MSSCTNECEYARTEKETRKKHTSDGWLLVAGEWVIIFASLNVSVCCKYSTVLKRNPHRCFLKQYSRTEIYRQNSE